MKFSDCLLIMHGDDSVAVAKRPLKEGLEIEDGPVPLKANQLIGPGHKIAIKAVADGQPIKRYGQTFGFAKGAIEVGDHVHTHNVELGEFARDYAFGADVAEVDYHQDPKRTFPAYARPGGRVGTRNYIAVISSVNCSASTSKYIAERFSNDDFKRDYPNIDGVIAFKHTSGCANDPGEPTFVLQRTLAGIARHPNVGGYLLVGLGCEVNQVQAVVKNTHLDEPRDGEQAPITMDIQSLGGIRKTVEAGVKAVSEMLPRVNDVRRTPQPISKLALAMNCGGSDGNSGITANPALGYASDELVRYRASSVLGETTEIYGAEHLLTRRAVSREVGEKLLGFVKWWEEYAEQHNVSINNNPSVGNKAGGLTTIYEKSLGAVAKGGRSPLAAVYQYAEQIDQPGFCFMDTPGFDPISMTGLVAGGCNVGVFTTGRGSVFGCKPTPCIKIATNTPLYNWMEDDMDINAGTILDGTESVEDVGRRIFEKIVAVAGGERTKSEIAGVGDEEFAPWILGSVL